MSIVANNLTNPGLNFSIGKKIVCDSKGILYCCFCAQVNSKYQIFVYKSEDDGNTWTDMDFPQTTGYNQSSASIAIDNNDKIHITWWAYDSNNTSNYQIKYSNNINGNWSNWINIQTITGYDQRLPSIAIDSNNKCHITWYGIDSSNPSNFQIKYSNNISGSWSHWININCISGYDQCYPSIAIDSNNKIHITWTGSDSNNIDHYQIKYSNNINGSWSNWINIQMILGYTQSFSNIVIDSNNKCHITWYGYDLSNTTRYQIKYSNNVSGTWNDWINIQTISGYNQKFPNITIDSNNKCHIIWIGSDPNKPNYNQIKYSNNISGFWSTYINKTNNNVDYQYPSCIFKNENLYCIYQGLDTIEFFSVISNKYLIQDGNNIKTTIDGINLIDLGPIYNKDTFIQYGMNNLNNINSTVLNKIINNEYKILMYKIN